MENEKTANTAEAILKKELEDLFENPPVNLPYSVDYWDPLNEDIFHWRAVFIGPEGTPYKKGAFEAEIILDKNYPISCPKIKFKTKIFNCNISKDDGTICVSLLNYWEITDTNNKNYFPQKYKNMREALFAISVLFYKQNPGSPMNGKAAELYKKNDKTEFENEVKRWVNFYALIENELYKDENRQKQIIS